MMTRLFNTLLLVILFAVTTLAQTNPSAARRIIYGTPPVTCNPSTGDVYIDTTVTTPDFVRCYATNKFARESLGKVNAQTGTSYTFVRADKNKLVTFSNGSAIAVTLPQATAAGDFFNGWTTFVRNLGAGTVTITPTTSTIDGAVSLTVATGEGAMVFSDGTNYSSLKASVGGGAPSGSAGGDLAGTYPNPTVAQSSQAFALTGDISPAQLTANTDNWNPTGLSTATAIRASTDASRDLTGLAGGADGRLIALYNIGSQNLVLKDEDSGSTAGNRFALSADVTVAGDQMVLIQYDSTSSRWRLMSGPTAGGGGTTINATDGRIPYRSNSTTFTDSQLIRHSLYHMARQDSSFADPNTRIFDWYYASNDNAASPSSYNRIRLHNAAGGDWHFVMQSATQGGGHFHIGTDTDSRRLYFRTNNADQWFIGETDGNFYSITDGANDIGSIAGNRPDKIHAKTELGIAGTTLITGGSHIVDAQSFSANQSTFRFQRLRSSVPIVLSQSPGIAGGSATWNLVNGSLIYQTMDANITTAPTISNQIADQLLEVHIIQDGTGSRTMTWASSFKWIGGTTPTLTTTANSRDIFVFRYNGTNYYEVSRSMDVR